MKKRTVSMLVMALAAEGLLVSLAAARSGLATGPEDQVAQPGPVSSAPRMVSTRPTTPAVEPDVGRQDGTVRRSPPKVGRSDATALARATRQQSAPPPTRVRLDSVGIDAPVRPVGVQSDGQMQLPDDPKVLGWYRFGEAPASGRGATVLAGHLDSLRYGIGPLVRLRDLSLGDTFSVTLGDGITEEYVVQQVRRFDRQGLPDQLFARTGRERLHLITCGGAYDRDNGGYQQNLVVTAFPVR